MWFKERDFFSEKERIHCEFVKLLFVSLIVITVVLCLFFSSVANGCSVRFLSFLLYKKSFIIPIPFSFWNFTVSGDPCRTQYRPFSVMRYYWFSLFERCNLTWHFFLDCVVWFMVFSFFLSMKPFWTSLQSLNLVI